MMGVIILWEVLENRDLCIIIAAVDRFYGDEKLRRKGNVTAYNLFKSNCSKLRRPMGIQTYRWLLLLYGHKS